MSFPFTVSGLASRPTKGVHRGQTILASALLAAMLLAVGGCAAGPSSPTVSPPDIVFISLDTLRRDHVGAYLPAGESFTPGLDRLAAESVVFDDAFAHIPFTLPSHLSMLTGLYPDAHGVDEATEALAPSIPTLAELLAAAGYQTLGLFSNVWMKGGFGFARGFEVYEEMRHGLTFADRMGQRALELLDALPSERGPFFLFLHVYDAHSDFNNFGGNTLPFYAPPPYLERLGLTVDSPEMCDADGNCATDLLLAADEGRHEIEPELMDKILALYRFGVEHLDHDLRTFFEGLDARGLWGNTLILVTADHGEELGDHGEIIHNQPYVENLGVPLFLKLPGGELGGTRRQGIVESIDLMPTLLELAGLEAPPHVQGRSLLPLVYDARPIRPYTFGRDKTRTGRYTLRTSEMTLVHDFETGSSELYDRRRDPAELSELGSGRAAEVEVLLASLSKVVEETTQRGVALAAGDLPERRDILSADEQERLRALGYLQ